MLYGIIFSMEYVYTPSSILFFSYNKIVPVIIARIIRAEGTDLRWSSCITSSPGLQLSLAMFLPNHQLWHTNCTHLKSYYILEIECTEHWLVCHPIWKMLEMIREIYCCLLSANPNTIFLNWKWEHVHKIDISYLGMLRLLYCSIESYRWRTVRLKFPNISYTILSYLNLTFLHL